MSDGLRVSFDCVASLPLLLRSPHFETMLSIWVTFCDASSHKTTHAIEATLKPASPPLSIVVPSFPVSAVEPSLHVVQGDPSGFPPSGPPSFFVPLSSPHAASAKRAAERKNLIFEGYKSRHQLVELIDDFA